jgi:hypothetical protein
MSYVNEHHILKSRDIIYSISSFLNITDKYNLMLGKKEIYDLKNILLKNNNKKACIITRFFRKALFIFNKIKLITEFDKKSRFGDRPLISTTKTLALYYFKYYDKKYIKPWFDNASTFNHEISILIDKNIINPSKYDLFRLHINIKSFEIINCIGW